MKGVIIIAHIAIIATSANITTTDTHYCIQLRAILALNVHNLATTGPIYLI